MRPSFAPERVTRASGFSRPAAFVTRGTIRERLGELVERDPLDCDTGRFQHVFDDGSALLVVDRHLEPIQLHTRDGPRSVREGVLEEAPDVRGPSCSMSCSSNVGDTPLLTPGWARAWGAPCGRA